MERRAAFLPLLVCPTAWEDAMCYDRNYYRIVEDKKAEEAKVQQQRRAGQIDKMLGEANKQAEEAKDATSAKDAAPAK
jgi:hypothetical protein